MFQKTVALLSFAGVVLGAETEEQWQKDCDARNFYITTQGQGYSYKRCDDNRWLKVTMNRLSEYDVDGDETSNKIASFSGGDWAEVNEDDRSWVQYSYTDGDITFTLSTRILNETEQFVGGTRGHAGDLKFSFSVLGWVWEDPANELRAVFSIDFKGKGKNKDEDEEDDDADDETEEDEVADVTYEGFQILSPKNATYVDAGLDPAEGDLYRVEVDNPSKAKGKNEYTVTMFYHGDDKDIYYDPLVGDSGVVSMSTLLLAVLSTAMALLI